MNILCNYCGKTFYKTRSRITRSKRHFCNQACKSNFQSERMSPDEQPNYKKGNVSKSVSNLCSILTSYGYQIDTKSKSIKYDSILAEDLPRLNKLVHKFDFKISSDSKICI